MKKLLILTVLLSIAGLNICFGQQQSRKSELADLFSKNVAANREKAKLIAAILDTEQTKIQALMADTLMQSRQKQALLISYQLERRAKLNDLLTEDEKQKLQVVLTNARKAKPGSDMRELREKQDAESDKQVKGATLQKRETIVF